MTLLKILDVTRCFGGFTAIDHLSLDIEAGEFFTLLGPSGCGKTTLLRMIAGFDLLNSGDILLDGKSLSGILPEKRPVHTVFQSYALFPHMRVYDNIALPLKMVNCSAVEIPRKVREALERVQLGGMAQRYPSELSGGQKQRVALARALVNRPRLLLLDEPLAALDMKLREQMQIELINLQKDVGITFIYVTHDQTEALALSHRIAVMNHGKVEQVDEPSKLYGFPRNRFVADFIGTCNLLDANVVNVTPTHITVSVAKLGEIHVRVADQVRPGQKGVIALRPEQVRITAHTEAATLKNHFCGRVHDFLYLGDVTVYIVELDGGVTVEALLPNSAPGRAQFFEIGDPVAVSWRHDAGHFVYE